MQNRKPAIISALIGAVLLIVSMAWWGRIGGWLQDWLIEGNASITTSTHGQSPAQWQAEALQLRAQLVELEELRNENTQLRQELEIAKRDQRQAIGVHVIGWPDNPLERTLVVDQGSSDGVREGMLMTNNGYVIGSVKEVSDDIAKVLLINDPTFRLSVITQDGRARGILRGDPSGMVVLEDVLQTQPLDMGEIVLTSGSQGKVPKGLPLGSVGEVTSADGAIFQTATVDAPIDYAAIEIGSLVVQP